VQTAGVVNSNASKEYQHFVRRRLADNDSVFFPIFIQQSVSRGRQATKSAIQFVSLNGVSLDKERSPCRSLFCGPGFFVWTKWLAYI